MCAMSALVAVGKYYLHDQQPGMQVNNQQMCCIIRAKPMDARFSLNFRSSGFVFSYDFA